MGGDRYPERGPGSIPGGCPDVGHLRATQALSLIDTSTDALEVRIVPSELKKLRNGQRVLDDALDRMENGEVLEASLIAARAKPINQRLKPAIELFLATPPGFDSDGSTGPEEKMENIIGELSVLLNDLDSDPSHLLATKLESVTATERTVRVTAFVLIPLGLGGVVPCGWLLSLYRRRAEATLLAAIDTTTREARTDELTGLPNRRALLEALDHRSSGTESFTLTLADLNGFKHYKRHLRPFRRRRAAKTARPQARRGVPGSRDRTRLGGDEFCVLLYGDVPKGEAEALMHEALSDEGEGFSITCAAGVVAVPEEARDPSVALRLVDHRMYSAKMSEHPSPEDGISRALTRMLDERHPGLGSHVAEVAVLAVACAEALDLSADDVRSVERAAQLHDIGKVGVPSEILVKQGPLNDEEWEFVRSHSIIGERILAGVPSLDRVTSMVRSSHERWDGTGYPDGLAGNDIPLGARIIFVADAFCAMTEARPKASARSVESARQELRACSGAQFDPAVVTAFLGVLAGRSVRPDGEASPALALTS